MTHLVPDRHAPAASRSTLRAATRSGAATAIAALALLIASATGRAATEAVSNAAAPEFGKWGVQTGQIAPSIAPGDDFREAGVTRSWGQVLPFPPRE